MPNVLIRLFVLIVLAAPLMAHAQGKIMIGYCNGEIATSTNIGVNYASDGIEVASLFTTSMLEKYDDLQAMGVNVGLVSRLNVAKITVWVRESLDADNIFEASLTKSQGIKTGWNSVSGELTPLPEGKDLYVGYTLELSGASYPVSTVGDGRVGGFMMKDGDEWKDMYGQGYGVLSIELVATASNLVPYDMALQQVTVPETIKIGATVPLTLKVLNIGVEQVKQFKVECAIDDYDPTVYIVDQEVNSNEYAIIELPFTPPMQEKCSTVSMEVRISEIIGGVDHDMSNNSMSVVFSVSRFDFVKRVLIEEFSTERCTYCPRAAASLHQLLSESEFDGNILAIVHHVGFSTDWLTIPASNNYLWFYNGGAGSTYAPAFMFDRYSFDNSSPVSNGTDEYSSIKQRVSERLSTTPMTALEAIAVFDPATSRLNIHVEGERIECYEGNRLTVCVIENNITAKHQAGVTEEFIHQHVARDINEIWGAEIDWADDEFTYDTSLYVNPTWNKDNVEVLAFISNYDPTDYKNCAVDNVAAALIDWNTSGITDATETIESVSAEYYTLSGLRVNRPSEGLYIVKRGDTVTKEYVRSAN